MATVYNNRNIEVKFFAKTAIDDKCKKELILYPILAHKIHAPVINDLELNIFQKYVLSLLNKGNYSLEKIAGWLCLDPLLIKTIAVELSNKGLLNINTLVISTKGQELVKGTFSWFNNAENFKKDIRYIFQDVFTQDIYPVIMPFDEFQENVWLEKGQLNIGTKGKRDSFNYHLIEPMDIKLNGIKKPETDEIIASINKHVKQYVPNSKDDLKEAPNAIKYLDEKPDLLFCATWIYSESKTKNIESIKVSDPFNVYDQAFWLKDNILKAEKKNNTLRDVIHSLVYNIEEEQKEQASDFMKLFDKELEKEINETFDFTLKNDYKTLYSAIKEYYFDIKFYDVHKDTTHLKNAFRKSQIVLETMFKIIQDKFQVDYNDVIDSQTYNGDKFKVFRDEIKEKIKRINSDVIFPEEKYPSYWRHRNFYGIDEALRNPDSASLRALFMASVLASIFNSKNPIYSILKKKNNFPLCVENIAENRNKFGHKYAEIPSEEIIRYSDDVKIIQKDIEEIIQIFLSS
jgi:hypothetical protein